MSVYRTQNGTWTYRFEYKGKEYWKRFKTNKEALLEEAKLRTELSSGFIRNDKITFREASQLFFEKHSKPNKISWQDDSCKIKFLNELFENKKLVDFDVLDIQNMRNLLEKKGFKSATVDRYHALIKAIFNKMIFWQKYFGYNPACGVKLKREPNARIRFFYKEELKRIESVLPENLFSYYVIGLNTGMRMDEVCELTWENVSLQIRDIYVRKSKSGKSRHIPINDSLYNLVTNLYSNGRNPQDHVAGDLNHDFVGHRFKKACIEAGIPDTSYNCLRHTFASFLVMNNMSIFKVSKLLGHSSVKITEQYYAHLAPNSGMDEVQKLNELNFDSPPELELGSVNFRKTFENADKSLETETEKKLNKISVLSIMRP